MPQAAGGCGAPRSFMASKLPGPLAPGALRARKPARSNLRLCTGAKSTVGMDMTIVTDFAVGLKVSVGEAELYWQTNWPPNGFNCRATCRSSPTEICGVMAGR
jgi:hypothetical protein